MALYLIKKCFVTRKLKRMQYYVCQWNSVGVGTIEIMILCITKNVHLCEIRLHVSIQVSFLS